MPNLNPRDSIVTTHNKKDEKFLRTKTQEFDFSHYTPKEINALIKHMREQMKRADGVGLSANQIGLPWRIFVAQVPDSQGHVKFYSVFNPKIEKTSSEKETIEEGCLSVPGTFGPVERYYQLVLTGQDKSGKKVKIKAWGLLARVFQHEMDHLNGGLFVDKAKSLVTLEDIKHKQS